MNVKRSSTRPSHLRQPWGYIHEPEIGYGFKRLSPYEIRQTVDRLHTIRRRQGRTYERPNKPMTEEQVVQMLDRLTKADKIPDSDRRVSSSRFRDYGISASFAWKGYN
ncbi:uncharacterized protein LOC121378976 [Gigantopelta aegis]|uniref:uncharacterized protein LOC121378976 n=1 Tax=Gigantopelta aegis TaxID=1735272 RepID=UPI001B8895B2|nr:uncharacterized protein LOC121378976 [Gigantopelta aegis]